MSEKVTIGSGNVYADIGLPDAKEMRLKSDIVGSMSAALMDIQRGKFRRYSVKQLMAIAAIVLNPERA